MRTKRIRQIGIVVGGEALINCWGGGQGIIEMDKKFIPNGQITHNRILNAINDGQFGCESIECATVDLYIKYDNCSLEYDRTIQVELQQIPMNCKRGI
jgi:hypothetical protein